MYRILFCFLILVSSSARGQVGIKIVNSWPQNRIAEATSSNRLFPTLLGAGIDYWFRLKKYRLEFFPAVHVQYAHENVFVNNEKVGKLNWTVLEFVPMLQFYPFDFKNDCMCPTFSRQGQFFKKGFFIQLAPGLAYSQLTNTQNSLKSAQNIFLGRLGAGMDIGISDLLTLSPALDYQLTQSLNWSELFSSTSSDHLNVYSGLFLSARLGWRFDRKNY